MIRKLLTTLTLSCCLFMSAQAQLSIGASAGTNLNFRQLASHFPMLDFEPKPSLGWQAALRLEYPANAFFTLAAEAGRQTWNSHFAVVYTDNTGGEKPGKAVESFRAWSGGLFAKLVLFKKVNGYVLAGPSLAFIQVGKRKMKDAIVEQNTVTIDLNEEHYNRTLYFAVAGAGAGFPCGQRGQIFTELRYQYGLTELKNESNMDATTGNLLLNFGYLLRL